MDRERSIRLWTSVAVCVIFALLLILIGQIVSFAALKSKEKQLLREQEKLQSEQSTMEEIIAYRESDRYVEQIAREYYHMVKEEKEEDEAS